VGASSRYDIVGTGTALDIESELDKQTANCNCDDANAHLNSNQGGNGRAIHWELVIDASVLRSRLNHLIPVRWN
jgi:hypothetical protein